MAARQAAQGRFTPGAAGEAATEYVDRHVLEQMHRRTLSILRSEVQPVPGAAYAHFLTHWQHVHPATRLAGEGSLRRVLQQLRAVPAAGRIWERDLLPLRLAAYAPAELAGLCRSGELVWVGSGGGDPRRMRLRFFYRGEGAAYLEAPPEELAGLGEHAQAAVAFLRSEGGGFVADVAAALDLRAEQAEAALWELAAAGLATHDSLPALRRLLQYGAPAPAHERRPISSLEEELAERLAQQRAARGALGGARRPHLGGYGARPGRDELAAARRRVTERLGTQDAAAPPQDDVRWTPVHRFGVLGKPLPPAEVAARQARQLLARWGVVTHASLEGEIGAWEWSAIYAELQRLEMRGEVRRGYFVQGLPGVQFALPEAVEQLRACAAPPAADEPVVLLNAGDPANLYGSAGSVRTGAGDALAFARLPSTYLALCAGLPVLLIAAGGSELTTMEGGDEGQISRALRAWVAHSASYETRLSVASWNGQPVLGSQGQPLLEAAGFYRDYLAMAWDRAR